MNHYKLICAYALASMLAGCTVGRSGSQPVLFDLGSNACPVFDLPARAPLALALSAAPALSDTGVIWRIGNDARPHAYANYRWVAPPAELVSQRLAECLSSLGPVLQEHATDSMPELFLTLSRFEQVFAPNGLTSEGRVVLQAVLIKQRRVSGQVRIEKAAAAPAQDAAGGVEALRLATDAAADVLARWLSTQLAPG